VSTLDEVLDIVDYVLVMSVNPGFGGQKFIPNALNKIRQLAARRAERGLQFAIQADGGVTMQNIASVVDAGVEWVVAGSAIFHSVNPAATFLEMQQAARNAAAVQV
jgi:ribulose-phosphate 3-epimerase